MENILNELSGVHGLTGAYIYQSPDTILQNTLPPVFKAERLLHMGKALAKIHGAGALNFSDLSEVVVNFDEFILIARAIAEKTWLVLLGERDLNVNMATLSVNLLLDDFKGSLAAGPAVGQAGRLEPAPAPAPAAAPSPRPSPKDLLERGPLAPDLLAMQGALAKVMGPMAKIIFPECLDKWVLIQAPSREKLPVLIDLVAGEIRDPANIARFRKFLDTPS